MPYVSLPSNIRMFVNNILLITICYVWDNLHSVNINISNYYTFYMLLVVPPFLLSYFDGVNTILSFPFYNMDNVLFYGSCIL